MTVYRPIPERTVAAMSVRCLVGCRLLDLDSSAAPGSWVFRFDGECVLTAVGTWRVIKGGRVRVAGEDHQQRFGLPAPMDAGRQAVQTIAGGVVTHASFDEGTGDLRVTFDNDVRLEVLTDSFGYESWTLFRPDGTQLVATGGGEVVPFGPEQAG
jgi:hypothetical protein